MRARGKKKKKKERQAGQECCAEVENEVKEKAKKEKQILETEL